MESATGLGEHDLFDFNSFENEVSDNEDGVDILKGFEKIGGPSVQMSADHIRRPSLGGRSFTSRF
jgi:hypothetical protein